MIRLTGTDYVNPQDITRVSINHHRDGLIVTLRTGDKVQVPCDYGKSAWETQRRLVGEINRADFDWQSDPHNPANY